MLSNIIRMLGRTIITTNILMIAPRLISKHKDPIISIFDIQNTLNVAAKKHIALANIDEVEEFSA
jgi:hypothetical protein